MGGIMPASHSIDDINHLIVTTWTGVATDPEFYDAFLNYYQNIKSRPEYYSFDEIVDFRETTDFKLSPEGLRNLVKLTSSKDIQGIKTKLAIVVTLPLGYGLAKMYEIYRNIRPNTTKELRVFRSYNHALDWIIRNVDIHDAGFK